MKAKYIILILVLTACLAGCGLGRNSGNLSISIKNNEAGYNFEAAYPERKTADVITYIEETLKDQNIFAAEGSIKDADIVLADSTKFYLKAEPGFLIIDFKKQKNSFNNYRKMENLCLGIKKVLGE